MGEVSAYGELDECWHDVDEAAETLRLLDQRTDSLTRLLDNAPPDDEPVTPEEEALVQEARDEIARGERLISLDELRAELELQ